MNVTKETNTNKGITLIALVITIIVMLILVAVTISMAVNGGLFDYAGKAVGETNNAMQAEQQLANGGIEVGGVWYNSIDEYLIASENKGEDGNTQNPEPETPEVNTITAATMQNDLRSYLGQKIAYGVTYTDASSYGNGEWEIFYADGEHIYIITRGHLADGGLTITGYNGTSDFTAENLQSKYKAVATGLLNKTYDPASAGSELKYTSTYDNMKATQYLLDSTVWASYANNDYAEWAIGAPTIELFVNSFNAYYPDDAVTLETPTSYGYSITLSYSSSVPQDTYLNHYTSTDSSPSYYWLACPSNNDSANVRTVGGRSAAILADNYNFGNAFRPVVCLSSDVQITWDEATSAYTISRAS